MPHIKFAGIYGPKDINNQWWICIVFLMPSNPQVQSQRIPSYLLPGLGVG